MSRIPLVLFGLSMCASQPALAADTGPNCNQLGREIALRASEQLEVPLDAQTRSELAALAEAACLEDGAAVPVQTPPVESTSAEAAPASAEAGTEAATPRRLFDIEVIDPADRVQRPGLKRR